MQHDLAAAVRELDLRKNRAAGPRDSAGHRGANGRLTIPAGTDTNRRTIYPIRSALPGLSSMTYATAISIILMSGIVAAFITGLLHRLIEFDLRRHHHDAGSVVFLQLGVVFAVLLAFVFNEVWSEYNEVAKAIDLEISAMHGVAMIAATLEPAQAKTILAAEEAYLEAVVHREWPSRNPSQVRSPVAGRGETAADRI
jgi:hypothetical protein